MRRFKSLLINSVDLRMPGLRVRTLAAHRHLPELSSVDPHRHLYSQAILYLSGRGLQTLGGGTFAVSVGTLVLAPEGILHSFRRADGRAPLCLLIDFQIDPGPSRRPVVSGLSRSELASLRQELASLIRMREESEANLRCEAGAAVLQILVSLLRAAGWLARTDPPRSGAGAKAVRKLLAASGPATRPGDLVRRSGYQRDHLNRLVKSETGLTIGQFVAQQRLSLSERLLGEGVRVGEVASAVGIPDASYFARWFRRQTGRTPSSWRFLPAAGGRA